MRRFYVAGLAFWLAFASLLSWSAIPTVAQDGVVLGDAPSLQDGAVIAASGTDFVTAASIPAVDISTRQASANFYAAYYRGQPASGWNGSLVNCNAGDTTTAFKTAVIDRIAFYRAMAGVPAEIGLSGTSSATAQQAALMFSRNGQLSHTPPSSWTCYTAIGAEGARKSNIVLGAYGVSAVDIYMEDPGSNNTAVGHRRWILYPQTQSFGTGDVPGGSGYSPANALWVLDANASSSRPATRDGFVAWPPPGYVPSPLIFSRWSFSFPNANFASASVNVTRDGSPLSVSIDSTSENGYGENTIVFRPDPQWWNLDTDQIYTVTISGVLANGQNQSFTYTVTAFDPSTSGPSGTRTPTRTPTAVSGSYSPGDLFKTTTSLSLRTGPSTSATRIAVLPTGTMGTVTGSPTSAGGYLWYPVTVGGYGSGWAAGDYFARVAATPTPVVTRTPTTIPTRTPTQVPATMTRTPTVIPGGFAPGDQFRTTTSLNMRNAPGTSATAIAVLPSGTTGQITGAPVPANGYTWYPVNVTGYGSGWTAGEYLAQISTPATTTPVRSSTPSTPPTSTPQPTRIPGGFLPGDIVRTTDSVNCRTGPGTSYRVISVAAPNSQATITGAPRIASGYTWYPLIIAGTGAGWIASDYLALVSPGNPSPTATPTATSTNSGTIVYTTANLNIRSGPGTGFSSLGVAAKGSAARVTGATVKVGSVSWYPLDVTGIGLGWASGTYLSNSPVVYAPELPAATESPAESPIAETPTPAATPPAIAPTELPEPTEPDLPETNASPQPVLDQPEASNTTAELPAATPIADTLPEWLPIERVQRSANAQPGQTLVDNDPGTIWFADGAGQPLAMVVFDLGQKTTFSQIRWLPDVNGLSGTLYLAVSSDGESWFDLDPTLATMNDAGWQILDTPMTGQYVRFVFVNDTGADWLGGLAEVRIMP